MKRLFSLFLSIVMVMSVVMAINPVNVYAASATSGSCGASGSSVSFTYNTTTKTLTITGTGAIKDYGSSGLNKTPWFDYREEIQTVNIGEGVTTIGALAFFYCTSLTSVSLPSTLTTIKGGTLNYGAFRNCTSLQNITLPEGLQTLDDKVFVDCTALKSLTLPDSLTTVGAKVVENCMALTTVTFGRGMTETGMDSFRDSGINKIILSDTITKISAYSFFNTRLTKIELPEQIATIGTRAFADCSYLYDVTVHNADCEYQGIIGEDPFNGSSQSITMHGHSASTTQTYAETKNYRFESIDDCDHATTHTVVSIEPTCTSEGLRQTICDTCGAVTGNETLPEKGHTYVLVSTEDLTEENGHIYKDYICTTCSGGLTQIEHKADVEGYYTFATTATCTRGGIETYTCTVEGCGNVSRKAAVRGSHTVANYVTTVQPTCTEAGEKQGKCSICSEIDVQPIPATGHTPELIRTEDNVEDDGHIYYFERCTVCGENLERNEHVEWVDVCIDRRVITNATCTIAGTAIDTCLICGLRQPVTIPANGEHVWYETTRTQPTCTAVGKIYYACENCNMTKYENIEALGHNLELQEDKCLPATCTTAGYETYKCDVCGYTEKPVISAFGHTPIEDSYEVVIEPTCEDGGLAVGECETCGEELEITLDALGHDFEDVLTPIREKPGHSLCSPTCTRCGYANTDQSVVHEEWIDEYTERTVITAGSCTIARVTRDKCTLCTKTELKTTEAPGHKYSYSGQNADGGIDYTCSNCNNVSSLSPNSVILLWNARYINHPPKDFQLAYYFELTGDDIINAKDYAQLLKLKKNADVIASTPR